MTSRKSGSSKKSRKQSPRQQVDEILKNQPDSPTSTLHLKSPAQVRDQVIWNGIRELWFKRARSQDEQVIVIYQDLLFQRAQEQENNKN